MNLPQIIQSARLPVVYEAAKVALASCSSLDECQDWADKAEALASYARQADDQTLRKHADRIQARAIKRAGELLKQIEPGQGARTDLGRVPTRSSAATDAGLSEYQRKTALRVANVSDKDFEEQIESDNPPTITQLANQGNSHLGGTKPADFARATGALAALQRFAKFAAENDPVEIASGVTAKERKEAKKNVAILDAWLDVFVTSLGD